MPWRVPWQHCKSYIMLHPTHPFCHTNFFTKCNMLTSFNPNFLVNIEEVHTPTWFASGTKVYCLTHKVQRGLHPTAFHGRWGTNLFGQIYWGAVLHEGLVIKSCQGRESFTHTFSSNPETVNLKISANHYLICTWI